MKAFVTWFLIFLGLAFAEAQTIFGKWKTLDELGKVEAIVEVYNKEGRAYARIVEIFDENKRNRNCDKCKGARKNKPVLGMNILSGLKKDGEEWNGGKILDPKNGKEYKCYITMPESNKLKLRGYIGISLIGRTEYWYRAD